MEVWKDIKDYEGIYQVSNFGRIKSLERRVRNTPNGSERIVPEKIMKPRDNGCGYLYVNLARSNLHKMCYVHRLVAEAFILNPDNKAQVNHLDHNRQNNCVENLEWCTAKENTRYSIDLMKKQKRNCEKMHRPKITSKPTTTGHRYIGQRGKFFRVHIRALGVDKQFKTLDEAIKYRDERLEEKGWLSQSYRRTRKRVLYAV